MWEGALGTRIQIHPDFLFPVTLKLRGTEAAGEPLAALTTVPNATRRPIRAAAGQSVRGPKFLFGVPMQPYGNRRDV